MNKFDWINDNIQMIKTGVKNGSFSTCLLRDYEIYKDFKNSSEPSIMQRYTNLSIDYRISEKSIRLIISKMKSSA